MKHWDILNDLALRHGYSSYLEIGVQDPNACFNKIQVAKKVGVDPFPRGECTFVGTSDEFFLQNNEDTFDLIFIDGLHLREQVFADIINSLSCLNRGGSILCHDTMPSTEQMQQRQDPGGEWTGDVWKAIVDLRVKGFPLTIRTLDVDYGCTLIRPGEPDRIPEQELTWENFQIHKKTWMNVVDFL